MARHPRKEKKEKGMTPADDLTRASTEEKKAFWDFLALEYFADCGGLPPYQEHLADLVIRSFPGVMASIGVGAPRSLAELADQLREQKRGEDFIKLLKRRKEERKSAEIPDLTKSSTRAKRNFWDAWNKAMESIIPPGPCDEGQVDMLIRLFSRVASRFGAVDSLEELREFVILFSRTGARYMTEVMQKNPKVYAEWDVVGALGDSLDAPENWAVIETTFDNLGKLLEEGLNRGDAERAAIVEIFNVEESLKKGTFEDDSAAFGAALKAATDTAFSDFLKGSITSILQGVHTKLDQMQRDMGRMAASQERLEPIADYAADLIQSHEGLKDYGEAPPLPKVYETQPGRKGYTVERERVTGTVDPVLFKLFSQDRERRGVTVSRMLDILIWQQYGKPKLSFEILDEDAPLTQGERDKVLKPKRKPGRPRKKHN